MKKKRTLRSVTLGLLLAGGLILSVAATQGSEANPLVTLGYLTEKFLPQVTAQVEAKAPERDKALETKLQVQLDGYAAELEKAFNKALSGGNSTGTAPSSSFVEVTLTSGQKLTLSAGSEVLFRSGAAACLAPSSPGLVDTTAGTVLEGGGALLPNHLYLSTADGRGMTASDAVTLLVRGAYQVS